MRVSERVIIDFTYQLSVLLSQSYLVQESLELMASMNTQVRIKKVIYFVLEKINSGLSFSDALSRILPLDRFFLAMIKAGEASGNLPEQIARIGDHLEKRQLYRQKLNKASLYPIVVFSVTLFASVIFIAFAVPMLTNFASTLQVPLPVSTQRFIGVMEWTRRFYYIPVSVGIFIWLLSVWFYQRFPFLVDYWKCSVPFYGKMVVERELALFSQQLSFLLSSHLALQESINIAASSIQNRFLREQIEIGSIRLNYGESVSVALQPLFSKHPFLLTALKTGEESNRLADNFAYLSKHYQQSLQNHQDKMLVLIEPIMLLTIGLFVFLVIIQFYLPIFQLLNQVDFINTW